MIGILGAGQLGRMLALAGIPLGLKFKFFDNSTANPCENLGQLFIGEYNDKKLLNQFSKGLNFISYEFENVPVSCVKYLNQKKKVSPHYRALEIGQDRIHEKTFFKNMGIKTPQFFAINTISDLQKATSKLGFPCVLKTRRFGYDGKGQAVLKNAAELSNAFKNLAKNPQNADLILEEFIKFDRELSIICVRSSKKQIAFYDLVENHHQAGILRLSLAPAPNLNSKLQKSAEAIAKKALTKLDYVGVLAIELFQKGNDLYINEMAPRVHNSGHWTIEGAETSQFENHLRAVCGMPLGSTKTRFACAMLNIIGKFPSTELMLKQKNLHLHLYGKSERPNRKIGHITINLSQPKSEIKKLEQIINEEFDLDITPK